MLFMPAWEGQTRPTLQGFIAWLERQQPDAGYQYDDCNNCAIGQYLKSIGTTYSDSVQANERLYTDWNMDITRASPHTFGAALERAREFAAQ